MIERVLNKFTLVYFEQNEVEYIPTLIFIREAVSSKTQTQCILIPML
jgi:hypothetical protein